MRGTKIRALSLSVMRVCDVVTFCSIVFSLFFRPFVVLCFLAFVSVYSSVEADNDVSFSVFHFLSLGRHYITFSVDMQAHPPFFLHWHVPSICCCMIPPWIISIIFEISSFEIHISSYEFYIKFLYFESGHVSLVTSCLILIA